MKLDFKVGRFYRTRDGRKQVIYSLEGVSPYKILGAIDTPEGWALETWTLDGLASIGGSCKDELDLVTEWVDPPEFNWSKAAAWHKFISMDDDGTWKIWRDRPTYGLTTKTWYVDTPASVFVDKIPDEFAPKRFNLPHRSLFGRPE